MIYSIQEAININKYFNQSLQESIDELSLLDNEIKAFNNINESIICLSENNILNEKFSETKGGKALIFLKNKIVELAKRIIKIISNIAKKVKAFFTNERAKKAEANVKDLTKLYTRFIIKARDLETSKNAELEEKDKEIKEKAAKIESIINKLKDNDIMYYLFTDHINDKIYNQNGGRTFGLHFTRLSRILERKKDDKSSIDEIVEGLKDDVDYMMEEANCISEKDYEVIKSNYTHSKSGELLSFGGFDHYLINKLIKEQMKETKKSITSDDQFLKFISKYRWIFYANIANSGIGFYYDQIECIKSFDYEKELSKYDVDAATISYIGKAIVSIIAFYKDNCQALTVNAKYAARQAEAVNIALAIINNQDIEVDL